MSHMVKSLQIAALTVFVAALVVVPAAAQDDDFEFEPDDVDKNSVALKPASTMGAPFQSTPGTFVPPPQAALFVPPRPSTQPWSTRRSSIFAGLGHPEQFERARTWMKL